MHSQYYKDASIPFLNRKIENPSEYCFPLTYPKSAQTGTSERVPGAMDMELGREFSYGEFIAPVYYFGNKFTKILACIFDGLWK